MLDTFNTEKQYFQSKQGAYDSGHIWISHLLYSQMPHLWHQQYSLGDTQIFGEVACRLTSKIVEIVSAGRNGSISRLSMGVSFLMNLYQVILIMIQHLPSLFVCRPEEEERNVMPGEIGNYLR